MELDDVIRTALSSLSRFKYLQAQISAETVERSIRATWPNPPAPLAFWLWVAGSDVIGHDGAEAAVASVDTVIGLLTHHDVVFGAWQSRINRLAPPTKGDGWGEHYRDFRAIWFELLLAFRLVTGSTKIRLNREQRDQRTCDLTVLAAASRALALIEAYAPSKETDDWYEQTVADPWRALVRGDDPPLTASPPSDFVDLTMDREATSKALARVLTTTNFKKQKYEQLSATEAPTILAVRGYGMTRSLHELATVAPPLELARQMGEEAWECLPEQCVGILLCMLGDVLKTNSPPVAFIPAPGKTLSRELLEFFDATNTLSDDVRQANAPNLAT